jgi:hypothetical protein
MAEYRRSNRTGDKADRVNHKGLQCSGQRVGAGEIELREDEPGNRAVDEEIVPFDRGADRAGDHRAAQLPPVLELRQRSRRDDGRHAPFLPRFSGGAVAAFVRLANARSCAMDPKSGW